MVKWFEVLKSNDIEIKLSAATEEETEEEEVETAGDTQEEVEVTEEKKAPAKKKAGSALPLSQLLALRYEAPFKLEKNSFLVGEGSSDVETLLGIRIDCHIDL